MKEYTFPPCDPKLKDYEDNKMLSYMLEINTITGEKKLIPYIEDDEDYESFEEEDYIEADLEIRKMMSK